MISLLVVSGHLEHLEIKDATDTIKYPTYIDLYLEFGSNNKT